MSDSSAAPEPALLTEPSDAPWPAAGIVRAVRRRADLSQRELARWAGVHHATIGRIEAGRMVPSIVLLRRIIGVVGCRLAVVDEFGRVLKPMRDWQDTYNGAERRYPSHSTPFSTLSWVSGGRTSTGWPARLRRSTATGQFGTRCGALASGRCVWPNTGTCPDRRGPRAGWSDLDTSEARRSGTDLRASPGTRDVSRRW